MKPRITRAMDLPPEERLLASENAYENGRDHVRIACQLSDRQYMMGQFVVLNVSMIDDSAVELEYAVDGFMMSYASGGGAHAALVELGNTIHWRLTDTWNSIDLDADYLQVAYSLDGQIDFVFGDEGEIFRREGAVWSQDETSANTSLQGMHGLSPEILYAVGDGGTLLKANGRTWEVVDLPVGIDLRSVLVRTDGTVIVAGDGGFAGMLRNSEFIPVETELDSDILFVSEWRGEVYFADSETGLFRLNGVNLDLVRKLGYVYRANPGDGWLTLTAHDRILQFDGSNWRGLRIFFDGGYRTEIVDLSETD